MYRIPNIEQMERCEQETNHFAKGINFYKLFWIFFIGCFLGVVIETIWCICTRFHYESRVGLIYGPFNLVYGCGALALTIGLYWMRNKSNVRIFLESMLIGSLIEYLCSFIQEVMFGTISWDYSHLPLNLHGRINLVYSIFWGILGLIWIQKIYPLCITWIIKIPNRFGKVLTWILFVFMIFNTMMSGLAVERWTQRREGNIRLEQYWSYFDNHYPDSKMKAIYPNMNFNP
ncbi:putative ABC transporter permease [Niameybacter massiliensis]|uniref:putative ABC transporter permease n=1 Tax=Niameybacter massiliensis TaxID=1658108 RepID=UPI000B0BB9C1|nr:putative ABC transporter permease [Niameybacter massiliensis]